jgi:hypothetical protein
MLECGRLEIWGNLCGEALLESDVRVGDNQSAQDGVHDGVEGASGEGSDGEGNEADADQSVIGISNFFFLRPSRGGRKGW